MAEITHIYLETNTAFSSTSASEVVPTNGSIAGGSLSANTKYLVIARALYGMNSANDRGYMQVTTADDTVLANNSWTRLENNQTAANAYKTWFFAMVYTTSGTPGDVEFRVNTDNSAQITIDQYTLLMIDLDALGTEGTDYFESYTANTGVELSDTAWGDEFENIAGSDLGTTEEWLVLGFARLIMNSPSEYARVRLHGADDASTASDLNFHQEVGEAFNDSRLFPLMGRHKAITSAVDLVIDANEESASAGHTHGGSFLIALPASLFADFEHDYTPGTLAVSTEATVASVGPYTPSVGGQHLVLGRESHTPGSGLATLHLEDGTTETRTGDTAHTYNQNWDSAGDYEAGITMQRINISVEKTYNLRSADTVSTDHEGRWLMLLSLNEPGGGGPADQSIEIDMEARKIRRIAV